MMLFWLHDCSNIKYNSLSLLWQTLVTLKKLYQIGEPVPCSVISTKTEGQKRSIDLSINPTIVNKSLPLSALKTGCVSWFNFCTIIIIFFCVFCILIYVVLGWVLWLSISCIHASLKKLKLHVEQQFSCLFLSYDHYHYFHFWCCFLCIKHRVWNELCILG